MRRGKKQKKRREEKLGGDMKPHRTTVLSTTECQSCTHIHKYTYTHKHTHLHGGGDFLEGRICLLLFSLQQCTLLCSPPLQLINQCLSFVQLRHACLQTQVNHQAFFTFLHYKPLNFFYLWKTNSQCEYVSMHASRCACTMYYSWYCTCRCCCLVVSWFCFRLHNEV